MRRKKIIRLQIQFKHHLKYLYQNSENRNTNNTLITVKGICVVIIIIYHLILNLNLILCQ